MGGRDHAHVDLALTVAGADRPHPPPAAGCALPAATEQVEAFGGELDARHNNYPQDTGRWRVERVF